MTISNKHLMIALTLSIMFVIVNIVAVISGSATTFYSQIDQLVFDVLPIFDFS